MIAYLGTAKRDITPKRPIPLAGYGWRHGPFEGVDRPLHARFYWFRFEAEGEAPAEALFVFADLICWGDDQMPRLRQALLEAFGLPPERIVLQGTHTHGGPPTSAYLSPEIGRRDEAYVMWLEEETVKGAAEARRSANEPVTISVGTGAFGLGIHRRKREDGRIVGKPNPEGPTDPEVTVVRFERSDGSPKGVWFHYTCHPTIGDAPRVDAEYPGAAAERLERELGPDALPAFVQGCCGDVRPNLSRDGAFYRGGDADIRAQGDALAAEVLRVLRGGMRPAGAAAPRFIRRAARLPFRHVPDEAALRTYADGDDRILAAWSRTLLERPERLQPAVPLELTYVRLAEGLALLAMNGEIVVEYGLRIKRAFPGITIPMGYANGMTGYVPTAKQVEEGGYEGGDAYVYFGLPSAFEIEIEERVAEVVDELAREQENAT